MYNVYTLTDGISENEKSFDDYESALYYYGDLIHRERAMRDTEAEYTKTTVHLFDAHESSMNPLAEFCIEGKQ